MLAAQTTLPYAQKVKEFLLKNKLMNTNYLLVREFDFIYFPINKKAAIPSAKVIDTKFNFPQKQTPETIDTLLKGKLTAKELEILPRSQEVVGKIMILEIPQDLVSKEKIIAEAFLKLNRSIETIVRKSAIHSGIYRTRKVKILAGKKSKETIHHENGIELKLHLEKTYFSARSAGERLRIAKEVKKNEEVLVMFSGAAPYPLVIAKNSLAKHVTGIEINPLAHSYAAENIILNKMQDKITLLNGDVHTILPKIKKKFDRIAMPLPKTGEEFIDIALTNSKQNTIIHFYAFLNETEIKPYEKRIKEICERAKHPVKVQKVVTCGQFSPGTFRTCFDLKVLK